MLSDVEAPTHRIPTLVQCCQRVAGTHADSICSLGDMRLDLIRPVLESCSPETLLRLENSSPGLGMETSDIWMKLCMRTYPIAAERYRSESEEEPDSWREEFFLLRDLEAKKFEKLGSKLRTLRQEADERKKENQIKITDRLVPYKRSRTWGTYQPKTLLQKTRTEAARMQKGIYGMRMIPPMPTARTYHDTPNSISTDRAKTTNCSPSSAEDSAPSSSRTPGTRVIVTSVTVRRPQNASRSTNPDMPTNQLPSLTDGSRTARLDDTASPLLQHSPSQPLSRSEQPKAAQRTLEKRDVASSLFIPKHRAYSQRPSQSRSGRSRS
ncbi:hypothetical protein WOLCODRAFT_135841 [Wolfiporia cocos MD-104 SS10]|uniref:Elongin-A n=1 Tax=Wolfiporia cocos (strain MD-104) TaxID=742152 RepID=A0A2H3JG83_WOLCO|nr:hypothetical protein WOLCODRAFT_135841 [Wolfiporia cocos MD-104 SS10]